MPWPVSQKFQDTLVSSDQHVGLLVQVTNHTKLVANLEPFLTGSVTVDATATTRRTCTLSFAATGFDYSQSADNVVPSPDDPTAPLYNGSGNEVRPYRGFIWGTEESVDPNKLGAGLMNSTPGVPFNVPGYPGVTAELCPLGVFGISKPTTTDTGDNLTVDITGNDRSAIVSARKWTAPYVIPSSTNINRAVQDLLNNRLPDYNLRFNMMPTDFNLPTTTFGSDLAGSNDPWADVTSLATAASMVVYFDSVGQVMMHTINPPANPEPVFTALYVEGDTSTVTQYARVADETTTYNGVIVIGTGSGGPPVQVALWNTDPSSPTYYDPSNPQGSSWGPRPFIYSTTLVPSVGQPVAAAYTQAMQIAKQQFALVNSILDTPSFDCIPNPAVNEDDAVYLVRNRINLGDTYTVAQMTIPVDYTSTMSVTCAPQ